jgi:hypothetical protein
MLKDSNKTIGGLFPSPRPFSWSPLTRRRQYRVSNAIRQNCRFRPYFSFPFPPVRYQDFGRQFHSLESVLEDFLGYEPPRTPRMTSRAAGRAVIGTASNHGFQDDAAALYSWRTWRTWQLKRVAPVAPKQCAAGSVVPHTRRHDQRNDDF